MHSFPEVRISIFPLMRAEIILGEKMVWLFSAVYATGHGSNKIKRHPKGLKMAASMPRWGHLWKRYKETKNPTAIFWRTWSKNSVSGGKVGYCACPLHSTTSKEWVKHPSHASDLTPGHTPTLILHKEQIGTLLYEASEQGELVCSWSHLLQPGPQKSFVWISCLASSRFLLIGEGQEPWLVT